MTDQPTDRAAAHHAPGGGFRNPWPGSTPKGFADLLRWTGERLADRVRGRGPAPAPEFPLARPAFIAPRATDGALRATWVGHSTVLLQLGDVNVLTDPVWSERASPFSWAGPKRQVPAAFPIASLPPVDVILLSHDHYDHLDAATVRLLAETHPDARWITTLGVGARLLGMGVRQVVELDWGDETSAGGAQIACTPAQHFSGRTPTDRDSTLWGGFALRAAGWRAFYAGDTGYHPVFAEIARLHGPFDLALMPIGAYAPRWFMRPVHMDADEAVAAVSDLLSAHAGHRSAMLPIHWGTFRLTDEPMDEPPRRAADAWAVRGLPSDDFWLLRHGETRTRASVAGLSERSKRVR
jgi:N-acyl-phosphatidylethanolamine-hydrolysing phospholipase D